MAALLNAAQVIRRVRQRLGLTQSALARPLYATVGTIQHWEHGRHRPSLARLLALRQLCPPGQERAQLESLILESQAWVAPLGLEAVTGETQKPRNNSCTNSTSVVFPSDEAELLWLRRQVAKLQAILEKENEHLRTLENRTAELHRKLDSLRASHSNDPTKRISN